MVNRFIVTFAVGKRIYELLNIFKEDEWRLKAGEMEWRGDCFKADMGEREGQYILDHQEEIPEMIRQTSLIFPYWHSKKGPHIFLLYWSKKDKCWMKGQQLAGGTQYKYKDGPEIRFVRRLK